MKRRNDGGANDHQGEPGPEDDRTGPGVRRASPGCSAARRASSGPLPSRARSAAVSVDRRRKVALGPDGSAGDQVHVRRRRRRLPADADAESVSASGPQQFGVDRPEHLLRRCDVHGAQCEPRRTRQSPQAASSLVRFAASRADGVSRGEVASQSPDRQAPDASGVERRYRCPRRSRRSFAGVPIRC